jgi:hypothetical protein
MKLAIKADTLQAFDAWKAGKPVRSLQLGHVNRMVDHPGLSPKIDESFRLRNDQARAHAYCFVILGLYVTDQITSDSHDVFLAMANEVAIKFEENGLTPEERDGAQSLAWKALLVGWTKAIDGHSAGDYIEVQQPVPAKATVTVNGVPIATISGLVF